MWTLVTGGSKRLGAEICRTLAKNGYSIAIHYRKSKQEAQDVAEECRSYGAEAEIIQGDFGSTASTEEFIKTYQEKFNTQNLINNVGNYLIKSLLDTSIEEWKDLYQTNVYAPLLLMQALLPSIKDHKGNIINIGTAGISERLRLMPETAYMSSKRSLWRITQTLAGTLAPSEVRVNMVSPGYLENSVDLPDLKKLPMQRAGTCSEIANAIAFLIDEKNRYITGANLEISGGLGL